MLIKFQVGRNVKRKIELIGNYFIKNVLQNPFLQVGDVE